MSVYKSPKSPYFQYDFVIKRRRFHGSTGQETRRGAEAFERRLRLDAAEGRLGEASQLTLDQAAGRWWTEHGSGRRDNDDVERRLERLIALIGKNERLADIDTPLVAAAVQRRRAQAYTRSSADDAKSYLPSNATVNRDVVETLRPILKRAVVLWGAKGLPVIDWAALKLQEPPDTFRIYSPAEQSAWLGQCGVDCDLPLKLLLTYGLRFSELFFPLDAFDADGKRLHMLKGRKRKVPHIIPLLDIHAIELKARIGRARAAGLETAWFVEEAAPRGAMKLRALTYSGLESRISSAADRAKIKGERRIHGARHHAGSDIVRRSKSLAIGKSLLGHRDIKSTMRYVHVLEDDLRAALEAEQPRNSPGQQRRKA